MKIGILGTGSVGNTIASRLVETGYEVMMGAREKDNLKALQFVETQNNSNASSGTFAEAAAFGEIVFNCVKGEFSLNALSLCEGHLKGKILVDIANPLDASQGMPPALIPNLSNFTSLGEEIQKKYSDTLVVKTLNTMWAGLMVNPLLVADGQHNNFISGNSAEAKVKVIEILLKFGWLKEKILDLGDITAARGMEAYLPFWLRIYGAMGHAKFNVQVMS